MWSFIKKFLVSFSPSTATTTQSLDFSLDIHREVSDKIGDSKMYALCKLFCKRITNDPLVGYYFKAYGDETLNNLAFKQTKFLSFLFGCSGRYTGKNMYQAHDKLWITQTEFNTVANHFHDSMAQLNIDPELITKIMVLLERTRDDIVGH